MIISNSPRATTTVTKMQGDNAVGMARRDPGRNGFTDRPPCVNDLQGVDVDVAALFANRLIDPQLLCGVWTNQRGIVPGNFRQRLRQFLQPAVVGKTAVVDCWVRAEDNLESPRTRGGSCRWLLGPRASRPHFPDFPHRYSQKLFWQPTPCLEQTHRAHTAATTFRNHPKELPPEQASAERPPLLPLPTANC